ncbi:MAG TPA: hypothetical protein VMB52_06600 [Verrucomicrobiae bacterium]|nr:hypothetical protein [Verrucomicrobiae bacterium]
MNAPLSSLMEKEVSRGEFLSVLGLAVVSVFGFSTILRLLTGKSLDTHSLTSSGYGSSAYGGSNDSR